jgi:hypothetical protein
LASCRCDFARRDAEVFQQRLAQARVSKTTIAERKSKSHFALFMIVSPKPEVLSFFCD